MSWEIVRIAWQSLLDNKFRSLLTILSVTIGAFSIVVMTSLAESGSRTLARSVEEIGGARLVWWVPDPPREARLRAIYADGIQPQDLKLMQDIPQIQRSTGMVNFDKSTVYVRADQTVQPDVVGMMDGLFEGLNWKISQGRMFTPDERTNQARVVVLTKGLEQSLFSGESGVGKFVTIFEKPYRVVGVLEKRKMFGNINIGFDWDLTAFIPVETAEKREGKSMMGVVLIAFTSAAEHNKVVMAEVSSRLKAHHNGVRDFKVINFGDIVGSFYQFFQGVNLIVAVIASISLVAGGIGVMNIMLVSVTERVKEIGIRKALGASVLNILGQFLGEATFLSTLGGLLGVAVGLLVVTIAHFGIAQWSEFWVSYYSPMGIFMSLGVTSAIGLFFGAVPAWQAARLDIVECLRR